MADPRWLAPELTWIDGRFEAGVHVALGDDGRIVAVDPYRRGDAEALVRRALLPGFVNAHSHAFQRGLRGLGESYPEGTGSFWTWRQAMYELVGTLDADRFRELCVLAFSEMRDCGITAVGEFHYLHHGPDRDPFGYDALLLEAADEVGIRLVLLVTHYRRGGFGESLEPGQARFDSRSLPELLGAVDRLAGHAGPLVTVGLAAHSLRAVPLDEVELLRREAAGRGAPFHVHLSEQEREVAACREAHGLEPVALALERLEPGPGFTTIHGTHAGAETLERYLATGASLCVCPLTEASLGDGIPELPERAGERASGLCLGTDANHRISMLDEMRWLTWGQRLRRRDRGFLRDEEGREAPALLSMATASGARALGLEAGRIEEGALADFAVVDLDHPSLADVDADTLPEALVFGAPDGAIVATAVGGRFRESSRGQGT